MNNIFPTGQSITADRNYSTSPTTPTQSDVRFTKKEIFVFNPKQNNFVEIKKEELTKEEEEKFYKKIFKTSLI